MATQTGRTSKRWTNFILGDSGNVLRNIPVDSINGVGLEYEEADVTAFQDAIKNALADQPDCTIEISGPFDTSAAAASPSLSGSHTVLSAIVGDNTPRTLDVQIGIRHAWESGEPQFGFSRSATSGIIVTKYTVNPGDGKYSATLKVFGTTAPAWGSAAEV
jgi:hypothetical protein